MAYLRAIAGLALVAACSSTPLKGSDGGQPDCTGLAVPAIACLVGPTVLVCALDQNGHPSWNVTCPGGNSGGAGGAGGDTGSAGGGGAGGAGGSNVVPPAITFSLDNGGATSVYIFEGCFPDLTITELSTPPIVIGRGQGCGICDCAQATCPPVVCGPCFQGGLEIAAAATQQYFWDPVDISYESRPTTECSHTRILPAGHYRIDVPVYASTADAVAKTGARLVTKTFDLPTTDTIHIQLASGAP